MFEALGTLCTVIVGGWLLLALFRKFDPDGELKAAVHRWVVSQFTRRTQ